MTHSQKAQGPLGETHAGRVCMCACACVHTLCCLSGDAGGRRCRLSPRDSFEVNDLSSGAGINKSLLVSNGYKSSLLHPFVAPPVANDCVFLFSPVFLCVNRNLYERGVSTDEFPFSLCLSLPLFFSPHFSYPHSLCCVLSRNISVV